MAPVFESPPPEDEDPEGAAVDEEGNEDVTAGKPVGDGVIVPGGLVVVELEPLISTPGLISGLSENVGMKWGRKDRGEDSYHRWSSPRCRPKDQKNRASVCDEHVSKKADDNSL